ncbi:MAG TPA: mevalonate kinase [Anaerolineales bacterium]|nr:mevalonate kinase [Anaerolineales bacterium]
MATASAPGKIILFGEHAVVYGRPALAIPVTQVHAEVEVLASDQAGIWINAPDIDLHAELNTVPSDHPIASVIHNFLFLSRTSPALVGSGGKFPNLKINISSTIPVASGLGSGAAVTVALVRALAAHLNHPMADEKINGFAYEIEKIYHGTPSGIDNTVVTYAQPVYFTKGKPIEIFKVGKPFTIVIGDTGISAPTKESVADVRKLWTENPKRFEVIFDKVADISFAARRVIEEGWVDMLGTLMNENHAYLQEMTVSSPELDRLVSAARTAGASGAKLSGGGRGGNMIALVEDHKAQNVAEALMGAGAKRTIITKLS